MTTRVADPEDPGSDVAKEVLENWAQRWDNAQAVMPQ
jgi:hypothetical protein